MSFQKRLDTALLAMRLVLAAVFLFHGSQKLFGLFGGGGIEGMAGYLESLGVPFPTVSALLAALSELLGGLALLTGFALRPLAVPLTFTMLVAAFVGHSGFSAQSGGMEYPLTLAVVVAALGLVGPGAYVLPLGARDARRVLAEAPGA